ncbi:urease accessory protein UreE [Gilvimarinus sp. 1_MG-2023]|uniref:urease accessory protein UreE n=1 Tax=Gilvimarinus sp. 1_MG-2023 TaxID=3062638 RepID=UPI0026E34E85|nr:urease accessory protein UreE [Gilvimarinus sp. 1_MG-2023]MDO6746088.1 urease accessory protein UreE [Gilvimarinus sp. 1_MG-2023]
MLEAFHIVERQPEPTMPTAELTFEQRQKSRHRCQTRCGQPLGWFLERGHVLADGEVLECRDGTLVQIVAANENVSQVESNDALALMRAAYHLGNRHVPLQIGAGFLRYQHDHVLDDMVHGLGLTINVAQLPFHPENGAYHGSGHGHSHDHSHSHDEAVG